MARKLDLLKEGIEEIDGTWRGQFRLRITVQNESGGADPYVFLFHQRPSDPETGEHTAAPIGVAAPTEMEQYPAVEPYAGDNYPFFRMKVLDVIVETVGLAEFVWNEVQAQVRVLLAAQDRLDKLRLLDTVTIGDSDQGGSDSMSSSGSL